MSIKDGGPAFPVFPETSGGHGAAFHGISMRDYFAAKAMQGLCAGLSADDNIDAMPRLAYAIADAMLAAREK